MRFKNNLAKVALGGALALGLIGCVYRPSIKEKKDLTGDGIEDILVEVKGVNLGTYLFIGQKDGSHIRARVYKDGNTNVEYFKTEDDLIYFWDGEFYKPSPKRE